MTVLEGPTVDSERADILDALRGFALLGIFISHIPDFSGHAVVSPMEQRELDHFGMDHAAAMIQDFLIRGKFYSLFSLLFGIGFTIQLESAARRGADFARHFSRRLTVLLIIGLIHSSLWYGDILKDYALIGFVLLLSRQWTAARIGSVAAFVFVLRVAWPVLIAAMVSQMPTYPAGGNPGGGFADLTEAFESVDPSIIFAANFRLVQLKALQIVYDGRAISILLMFLLGALVGKLGLHRDLPSHRKLLGNLVCICLPVGVIGNAVLTPLHAATPDFPPDAMWVIENALYAVAVPALAVAYASGFAWLWASGRRSVLRLFAPVGRMALTTYIAQTLIGVGLFYGIGLGLRGQIGLVGGTGLAIGIFVLQAMNASLWLRWFRFGPIEWFWRCATYGTPIAMWRTAAP